jgi:hypothetical protein
MESNPALIRSLLEIISILKDESDYYKEQAQTYKDLINKEKGELGSLDFSSRQKKSSDYSSDNHREPDNPPNRRGRVEKNSKIQKTRTVRCNYPPDKLPPDAQFKGLQRVIVQDIKIEADNVELLVEVFYSPSTGKTYRAEHPPGYEREFGPRIRSLIFCLKNLGNMSESGIYNLFKTFGIHIGKASISRIGLNDVKILEEDSQEILKTAIQHFDYINIDDTGSKIFGTQHYSQILTNPFFTAYITLPSKNRLSILKALLMGNELQYLFNQNAFDIMKMFHVPEKVCSDLHEKLLNQVISEKDLLSALDLIPTKNKNPDQLYRRIMEASGIAWYHTQDIVPVVKGFVSDDAPQFQYLAFWHSLCWVHVARPIKKLNPIIPIHIEEQEKALSSLWEYYRTLMDFKRNPAEFNVEEIREQFDSIFSRNTGYPALDKILNSILANKEKLLMVLKYPQIPLHNNEAELGARALVRKRDVSLHSRSSAGAKAVDIGLTITQTAKKIGVNTYEYVLDRFTENKMERLAKTILRKAGFVV